MNLLQLSIFMILLVIIEIEHVSARYDRVGFVSDPIELLLQDSHSSLRNLRDDPQYRRPYRQIQKRRYSSFPPSFYTSTFGFGDSSMNRRHVFLPYADLLFNGR